MHHGAASPGSRHNIGWHRPSCNPTVFVASESIGFRVKARVSLPVPVQASCKAAGPVRLVADVAFDQRRPTDQLAISDILMALRFAALGTGGSMRGYVVRPVVALYPRQRPRRRA